MASKELITHTFQLKLIIIVNNFNNIFIIIDIIRIIKNSILNCIYLIKDEFIIHIMKRIEIYEDFLREIKVISVFSKRNDFI